MDTKQQVPVAASPARIVPNPLPRRVSMESSVTPQGTANAGLPTSNAGPSATKMPEPSPNKSAAAFALSLLGQQKQNTAPPPPQTAGIPNTAPPSAFQSQQQQAQAPMPHPTPTYPWQQQQQQKFRPFPGNNESLFPAKRQKVSHAQVIQSNSTAPQPVQVATPHQYVMPSMQYASPYAYLPYSQSATAAAVRATSGIGLMVPVKFVPAPQGYHSPPDVTTAPPMKQGVTPATVTSSSSVPLAVPPPPPANAMVTPTPNKKFPQEQNFSRKTKSLGALCQSFVTTYTSGDETSISIDQVSKSLGVERRRIYDVINIFESVEIVQRKCKNTYEWLGTSHLPKLFGKLQQDAFVAFTQDAIQNGLLSAESQVPTITPNLGQKKSLGKLSQQFVQLFLVGNDVLSLTDASDKILGKVQPLAEPHDEAHAQALRGLKTKTRRLYDISNVFCALGICKKLGPDNRRSKPYFQWTFPYSPRALQEMHMEQAAETRIVAATSKPETEIPSISTMLAPPTPATAHKSSESPPTGTVPSGGARVATSEQPSVPTLATAVEPPIATPTTIGPSVAATSSSTLAPGTMTMSTQGATNTTMTLSSSTPVCDNKTLMANINAMGAAAEDVGQPSVLQSTDETPPETELCRTVSLSHDL